MIPIECVRATGGSPHLSKTLGESISSKRKAYLPAYAVCTNIEDTAIELVSVEKKVLRQIYQRGLGISLASIGAEGRTFLGLE
jgi:hypothetical protein